MKYPSNPEVIASLELIDKDGETYSQGDKIVGLQVRVSKDDKDGTVDIDVRDFGRQRNLVIRIPLPELMAALSCATLNADRDA